MKNKGITITDVARQARVSPASVSRYLNGVEGNLSVETAERIREAIDMMGYRPNAWARSLKTRHSGLLAVVVPDLRNSFVPAVLDGIETATNSAGFSLLIGNAQNDWARESALLDRLLHQRVEGIILQPASHNASEPLRVLIAEGVPIVLIDRLTQDELPLDMVGLDNSGAIRMALDHLQSMGYRQLVYVTDPPDVVSSRREREQAILACQSGWDVVHVAVRTHNAPDSLIALLSQTLDTAPRAQTAVLCGNAVTALYALKAIDAAGYRVPDDLGLMTIDDPDWAPYVLGGITSLAQPTFDLGSRAAQRLLDRIRNKVMPRLEVRLPGQLLIRNTTMRPF